MQRSILSVSPQAKSVEVVRLGHHDTSEIDIRFGDVGDALPAVLIHRRFDLSANKKSVVFPHAAFALACHNPM
jgi:hypothetical protein